MSFLTFCSRELEEPSRLVELETCFPWPPLNTSFPSDRRAFFPIASPSITSPSTGSTQIRPAIRRLESRGHSPRRLVAATVTVLSCPLRRAPFSSDLPLVLGAGCWVLGGGEAPIQASSTSTSTSSKPGFCASHRIPPLTLYFLRPLVLNLPHRTAPHS
jgi:hypothetical protein